MNKDVIMDVYAIEYTDGTKAYRLCLTGKTYQHKEEIKALGFTWNGDCWEKESDYTGKDNMVTEIKSFIKIEWIAVDRVTLNNASMKLFG